MATTAHRAPEQGFLGGEVLPSKVLQRECAERQAHASRRTFFFVIWTWEVQRREVVGDLRWWQMVCHFFGRGPIAVDTTLVSALHCEGSARGGAVNRDGVPLAAARRRKERCSVESLPFGRHGQRNCRKMVVGSTGVPATKLAKAKAPNETPLMQRRVQQAWKLRWLAIMSCATARAVASSLLEMRGSRWSRWFFPSFS